MQPHHLIFLIVDLGAVVCLVTWLCFLLRCGFQAATVRGNGLNTDGLIYWNESIKLARSRVSIAKQMLKRLARGLQFKVQAAGPMVISGPMIADPVDGTGFQEGEAIVRCACGTSYHQYSWQWLGEKNEGRCVNCRRPGLISTCTAP
jgi:hypothetical protein